MSIKLRPDGTVEADTPEELVAYQRFFSRNGHVKPTRATQGFERDIGDATLPEAALKLVKLLWAHQGGMDTREIAKSFGLDHTKGIGGSVTSLAAWGRRQNLGRKQMLVKTRRPDDNGRIVRVLSLSDFFRKMIKEGKVPGVKLDS